MKKERKKFKLSEKEILGLTGDDVQYKSMIVTYAVEALIQAATLGLSVAATAYEPGLWQGTSLLGTGSAALSVATISRIFKLKKIRSGLESGEIKKSDLERRR